VNPSQILVPLIIVAYIGWIAYRRTRPQPVQPGRTIAFTLIIVALSLFGLVSAPRVLTMPLFLVLAPVALLAGLGLGWAMMKQIRFWRDQATGQVWMGGGFAYVAIWLATMAVRIGIEYASGGFEQGAAAAASRNPTNLTALTSDLLFLSTGLWLARGYILLRRAREEAPVSA
jgi:hypothetical protein